MISDLVSMSAERIVQNDAAFREANEKINDAASSLLEEGKLFPVICECADEGCTKILQLTSKEYEAVRRDPTHFINAHGHHESAGRWAQPVEAFEHYTVVVNTGKAAEIVTDLNPDRSRLDG